MIPAEFLPGELASVANDLRANEKAFAFATIVRTAGATAAKPGAKALLGADGTILHGWLGGGCTHSAVKRAAITALQDGQPQLVSVAPEELLNERGISAGQQIDGTSFARNGCPSKGSVDIFIEPCLPMPQLVVLGGSPVAESLVTLAPQFHWAVMRALPDDGSASVHQQQVIVIATQGTGDVAALQKSLSQNAMHIAFVGSARKFETLAKELIANGADPDRVKSVKAPAGLDLGAVTPEEIALSILAELVQVRRARVGLGHASHTL